MKKAAKLPDQSRNSAGIKPYWYEFKVNVSDFRFRFRFIGPPGGNSFPLTVHYKGTTTINNNKEINNIAPQQTTAVTENIMHSP